MDEEDRSGNLFAIIHFKCGDVYLDKFFLCNKSIPIKIQHFEGGFHNLASVLHLKYYIFINLSNGIIIYAKLTTKFLSAD